MKIGDMVCIGMLLGLVMDIKKETIKMYIPQINAMEIVNRRWVEEALCFSAKQGLL